MKLKPLLISIAFLILSSNVYAGAVRPFEVEIDFVNKIADGDMASARFSDSNFAYIGCGIRKISLSPAETISFGFCQANNGESEDSGVLCTTQNPEILSAIDAVSDFSFVTFSWNDDNECTRIGNSTQSFYLPNFKLKKAKK